MFIPEEVTRTEISNFVSAGLKGMQKGNLDEKSSTEQQPFENANISNIKCKYLHIIDMYDKICYSTHR